MEKEWLKADLHTHSRDDPVDGDRVVTHSTFELIDRAAELGYRVLGLTNHRQYFRQTNAFEYAAEKGILILPGVEASLAGRHVLLYNFPEYEPDWTSPEMVERFRSPDRLVIAPHPFFPTGSSLGRRAIQWIHIFDAIEYSGMYLRWINFNRPAVRLAEALDLPLVGNCDVHFLYQLGPCFSLIYARPTVEDVIRAVRAGHVRLVHRPGGVVYAARFGTLNLVNRLRYWIGRGRRSDTSPGENPRSGS